MARPKTSKSDLIRQTLADLGPEARNRDVIEKLAADKVTVSAQMVSTVRARMSGPGASKAAAKLPGRPGRRPAPQSVSLAALLNAKKLVTETGSVEAARQTLDALAQLV
jgi:hypothetical protein